jgi:hypothetical protein
MAVGKWRTSVERYPDAFAGLKEEWITSLLVTTLNVVFDTAQREVFQSAGKADIMVQAGIGRPNEAAYIGEAKIWVGAGKVCEDAHQVLGYCTASTRDVLLIYYIRQLQFDLILRRLMSAVENCGDFHEWAENSYFPVAVFRHPRFHREVRVHLAHVHVPKEDVPDPDEGFDS